MLLLKNLSVRGKLLLLVIPALLALIFFAGASLLDNKSRMQSSASIAVLVDISASNSSLVHELQKERGTSAGFLGSKGASFGSALQSQRRATDGVISSRQELLDSLISEVESREVLSALSSIKGDLSKIAQIRRQVSDQSIPLKQALGYYTGLNKALLATAPVIAAESQYADITKMLASYYSFLQSKERAGIERAVMSNVFRTDFFAGGSYPKFLTLVAEQNAYMDGFKQFASDAQLKFYDKAMSHSSVSDVDKYRVIAGAEANFEVDSADWFKAATGRINQLKSVEDSLTEEILATVHGIKTTATSAFYTQLITVAALLLLIIALVQFLQSNISAQLKSIIETMHVAAGEKDLTVRAEVIFHDDIGRLAISLNDMFEVFAGALDEIGKASHQLAAASEETSSTVVSSRSDIENTRTEADMVATASEEMSSTVQEVATNTSLAADAASRANDKAKAGGEVVTQNTAAVRDLADEIQGIGKIMEELHSNSSNITSVIEVIKSVAEQTNLLALNAAIEAARAGEQGRGFAVVADEVRTLAQRTQDSTSEIDSIISEFSKQTEKAFESVKQGCIKVEAVAEEAVEVEKALDEIESEVSSITNMMQQIATASEEQVATTHEITNSISSINNSAQNAATGAEQIETVAGEQAHLASSLQDLSSAFKV